jgi:hypothetical protein
MISLQQGFCDTFQLVVPFDISWPQSQSQQFDTPRSPFSWKEVSWPFWGSFVHFISLQEAQCYDVYDESVPPTRRMKISFAPGFLNFEAVSSSFESSIISQNSIQGVDSAFQTSAFIQGFECNVSQLIMDLRLRWHTT